MPFGLFTQAIGCDFSLAQVATSLAAQAHVSYFLTSEMGSAVPATWTNLYKMAYEKALAAQAPSRFQVMIQPCMN